MKRRSMRQRLGRLAVGSLCLLTLMVHTAPAATSRVHAAPAAATPGETILCPFAGVEADGKTSTFTLFLYNPLQTPLTYEVGIADKGSAPTLTPHQVGPKQTTKLTDQDLAPGGVTDATLVVGTADPTQIMIINLYSSKGSVETAVPRSDCYVHQGQ